MKETYILTRNFTIRDEEIFNMMKINKIEFLHYYAHREKNGAISIIAKRPSKNEMTVAKGYHKIKVREEYAIMTLPKFLIDYKGKLIRYYVERLYPQENEIFRIQAVNFNIETTNLHLKMRNDEMAQFPYFSKGGELVIPQFYLNRELKRKLVSMSVSFGRTLKSILGLGFIFVHMIKSTQKRLAIGKDLYSFRKFSNGLRTKKVNSFIEFLNNNSKDINDYNYVLTMPNDGCPYGIMVFEGKRLGGKCDG